MAKGPESVLWNWLKSGLPTLGRPYHVERVENAVSSGRADVEGVVGGVHVDIELKVAHYVRADGSFALEHYTNTQAYWHHRRTLAGGKTWLLVRVGDGAHRSHYLLSGIHALDMFEERLGLTEEWLRARAACPPEATCHRLWNTVTA